jgi:hypothetical protein
VSFQVPGDTSSWLKGEKDGFSLCGERSLTIRDPFTGLPATGLQVDFEAGTLEFTASEEGLFTFDLTFTLDLYPDRSVSKTLSFDVVNPCPSTVLDEVTLPKEVFEVQMGKSLSITLLKPKDSASREFGNQNGLSFCGPRSFQLTTPSDSVLVTYAGSQLKIQPTEVGEVSLGFLFQLDNYPEVVSETLTVVVQIT